MRTQDPNYLPFHLVLFSRQHWKNKGTLVFPWKKGGQISPYRIFNNFTSWHYTSCRENACKQELANWSLGYVLWCFFYLADFFLWNTSQECKELQVLSPCHQFIYSIELWAVAHVLMDFLDVGQDTVKEKKAFVRISWAYAAILDVKTVWNSGFGITELTKLQDHRSPFWSN